MDPLGPDVRRELDRFGPQGGMAELLEAWPAAVGADIARNAWPARFSRDGTLLVHTADAIWAFELGHRAAEIADRLGVKALRFAAGPLPELADEAEHVRGKPAVETSPEDDAAAAEIAATVEDEELRARIERAVSLSLARARSDRSF
ncbi:MAG TPA: DUF721 domain-containing protein [Gaiellaceae bacterium]